MPRLICVKFDDDILLGDTLVLNVSEKYKVQVTFFLNIQNGPGLDISTDWSKLQIRFLN